MSTVPYGREVGGDGKSNDPLSLSACTYTDLFPLPSPSPSLPLQFTKEWIVCNSGSEPWRGVTLKHVAGVPPLSAALPVPDLQPGGETCVRVTFPAVTTLCPGQILTR